MLRTSTAWAASCAAVLLTLSGCRFFGIDNRPDIRYVTETERKEVTEPMYSMAVPGTRLFKQWPMRHGPDYGYAPWEKKQGVVMANAPSDPATNAAAANAASNPAGVASQEAVATPANNEAANATPAKITKAAPNKAMVMAEAAAKSATKPGKPSGRATPLLPGESPEDSATAANEAWSGSRVHAGDGAVAVADDLDVPVAARGDLEFRAPGFAATGTAQPQAAAMVSKALSQPHTTRPPAAKNLAWRENNEGAVDSSSDELASDLYVDQNERAAAMATASDIGLQQPGAFAARKPVTAKARVQPKRTAASNNVLRDEAVRPASATMPVNTPKKTPRTVLPAADFTPGDPSSVDAELVPPSEEALGADPLESLPAGMSDEEAVREEPESPTRTTRPRMVAPPVMRGNYESGAERAGTYHPASEPMADDEVFVTASDMSGELPYGEPGPTFDPQKMGPSQIAGLPIFEQDQGVVETTRPIRRANANPHVDPDAAPREYVNPHYQNDAAGDNAEVNDALEAAKRAVLQ